MAPLLFTVPGLGWEIQSYGFFMGLALVVGWVLALALARADRLPADVLGTAYVVSVALGLFAARGAWLAQHPGVADGVSSWLSLSADGLAPFAGVVAALVVSAVLATRQRVPVTAWFDVIAPAFAVGTVLERIGALLAGTGYGRYAPDWPLSITFGPDSPAFADHGAHLAGLMPPGAVQSLPVHPTQLYGAVLGALGLWLALALRRRRTFSGQVFVGYAIYVVVARIFVEEWFRADAIQPVLGPFNPGQVAALGLLVGLTLVLRTRARRAAQMKAGLRYWEGGRWSPAGSGADGSARGAASKAAEKPRKAGQKKSGKKGKRRR